MKRGDQRTVRKNYTVCSEGSAAASERARHAAHARHRRPQPVVKGHPTTSDIDYSASEWEFISAVAAYQNRTGIKYPTWREIYHIFVGLGYDKTEEISRVVGPVLADLG